MQQEELWPRGRAPESDARIMEGILLNMRQMWFGASSRPFHGGVLVTEPEGELVTMVDASEADAEQLIGEARSRRAYMVATPFSRPSDLGARLRRAGFRTVHRQGTYTYEGRRLTQADLEPPPPPARRGIFSFMLPRPALRVTVETVAGDVSEWNHVCWRAFSPRGISEAHSLAEKRRALAAMAGHSHWYLARYQERAVGCAILYQGEGAAHILAVGTLAAYRRRGVATALVRQAIWDWQQGGEGFLFLDTVPSSGPERLYQSLGFREAYIREIYAP